MELDARARTERFHTSTYECNVKGMEITRVVPSLDCTLTGLMDGLERGL